MAGDKYILHLFIATKLRFRQTNNTEQLSKQWAFASLISCGARQAEQSIPPHRQCFSIKK